MELPRRPAVWLALEICRARGFLAGAANRLWFCWRHPCRFYGSRVLPILTRDQKTVPDVWW